VIKDDPRYYSDQKKKALERAKKLGLDPNEPGMMSALRGVGFVEGGRTLFDLFDDQLIRATDVIVEQFNKVEQAITSYEGLAKTSPEAEAANRGLIRDCERDLQGMRPVIYKLSQLITEYRVFILQKREREHGPQP